MIQWLVLSALVAAEGGGGAGGALGGYGRVLIPTAGILVLLYFLVLRPQQKRDAQKEDMRAGLKERDKIITVGGIYGTVKKVGAETVIVRIDDKGPVEVKITKSAVHKVLSSSKGDAKGGDKAKDAEDD